ncbi:MAG: AAA family ATPase [Acidobacteriota bacterium]|nr:MAG: AAA family ATPase [Acidobacteriota bacterium]
MRIRDIHIDGFGIFEDFHLEGLKPGINLLVGENEAGKSTLMKFLKYTLFGYPRSKDQRMDPLRGGNHGGRIVVEANGGSYVVDRRPGVKGGLIEITIEGGTDPADLRSIAGTASMELFENVYAFSLAELVDMESLKDSGVEDRIFSIGLGLGGRSISGIAGKISSRADELYKASGSKNRVAEILKEVKELEGQISDLQAGHAEYKRLAGEIRELEASIKDEEEVLGVLRKTSVALDQLIRSYESYAAIAACRNELESLPDEAGFAEDIEAKHDRLLEQQESVSEDLRELRDGTEDRRGIRRLRELIGEIVCNEELLSRKDGVEHLRANVVAYEHRVEDRESLRRNATAITSEIIRGMEKISEAWNEDDLASFAEETAHLDRLEQFAGRFEEAKERKREIRLKQEADAAIPAPFPIRPVLVILAIVLAIASAPLFYYGILAAAIAVAAIAAVVIIGSFFVGIGKTDEEAEDEVRKFEAETVEPLERKYREYLIAELKLSPELSPEKAKDAVKEASRLKDRRNERETTLRTIGEQFDSDIAAFEEAARELADVAGIETPGPADAARRIADAYDAEKEKRELRAGYERELADLISRERGSVARLAEIADDITELYMSVGVEDEAAFRERIAEEARVKELKARIAAERNVIGSIAGPERVDEVVESLEGREKAELDGEKFGVDTAVENRENGLRELTAELGAMRNQKNTIEGESDLPDLLAEKEVLANRLRAAYEEWLARKVSLRLFEEVREEFERDRQPAVIRNTGRHFGAITHGRYERVSVALEDKAVAVFDGTGRSKSIDELSRGTKEQLLISLRLGFIEEYERESEPLPVIVDDVFVNFDDGRAAEAASVFWDFANGSRQILIFTCHPRTRDFFGEREVNEVSLMG